MAYQVKFTETTNSAKPAIVVEDKSINTQTDLGFIGQNYAGYAPILAENFLHLLENFAKGTPPPSPVEGQIWYDNTTGENLLKVYDGTTWNPTGSIKKAVAEPAVANSSNGDLWVNPVSRQLYIFSGLQWELIGPQFSSGLKTGSVVESIVDTLVDVNDTAPHSVISFYTNNERIAIFSAEAFIPKSFTVGFPTINRGINLSTVSNNTTDFIKFWGTASAADALVVNDTVVKSSNFLRSDVPSTTTASLNIRADDGISVGKDLGFNINLIDSSVNLVSKNKNIEIGIHGTTDISTVIHVDIQKRVGIGDNNISPQATLDVLGTALVSETLQIGLPDIPGGLTIDGTMEISGQSTFNDIASFNKPLKVYNSLGGAVILPLYTPDQSDLNKPMYDIGSQALPFRNIYANSFVGTLSGNVTGTLTGNVTGSASYLKKAVNITLAGDVTTEAIPFNGQSDVTLTATISQGFITSKTAATETFDTDQILTFRTKTGLQRTSKQLFLSTVPSVPAGAIFPFAGGTVPAGYLLCDGSEVLISSYPELFSQLKYAYRNTALLVGVGTFALPDLRGRFPLGRDNMDNDISVPTSSGSVVHAGGKRNGTNLPTEPANRVQNTTSKTIGLASGNDTLGVPAVNGTTGDDMLTNPTGQLYSIMNPYLTINYIIFTGVL